MSNASTTTSRPASTRELLASLRDNRVATLKSLTASPFQITGDPIAARDFWTMFEAVVRPDGTVDTSALTDPANGGAMAVDPVSVGAFILVCGLLVSAFSAGYVAGKDAADTDDADDEAESDTDTDTEADRLRREQSTMTFAPGRRGLAVRVLTTAPSPRATDLSAQKLLANLRADRAATLEWLRGPRNWRVITDPMPTNAVWEFIDLSVSSDGMIDLPATNPPTPSLAAPVEPAAFTTLEIMVAIGVATVVAGVLGFEVGYAANDNEAPGSDEEDETNQGGGSNGDDSSDTGVDGGAGRGVVATPVLRNGSLNAVDLTFRDASLDR